MITPNETILNFISWCFNFCFVNKFNKSTYDNETWKFNLIVIITKPNLICGNIAGIVGYGLKINLFTKIIRNFTITQLAFSAAPRSFCQ